MAKLTLSDITGGYQTATAYNANNALIEAALENTLSLDGTTPNQMGAILDMNSYNVNNVATLNATSVVTAGLTLNGAAITTTTTLTGGLAASEVTYSGGTLSDALDNDYIRDDVDGVIAGDLQVTDLTATGNLVAVDATLSGNLAVTGTVTGAGFTGTNFNFPDTFAESADANTLDDYQESEDNSVTIAPNTSGTITVSTASDDMKYTKIGDMVHMQMRIIVSGVSSPVGTYITYGPDYNMKYTTLGDGYAAASVVHKSGSTYTCIPAVIDPTVDVLKLYMDASTVSASDEFYISATYHGEVA